MDGYMLTLALGAVVAIWLIAVSYIGHRFEIRRFEIEAAARKDMIENAEKMRVQEIERLKIFERMIAAARGEDIKGIAS